MKKGRILVVDDNKGIRAALELLLPPFFSKVELIPSPATLVSMLESFKPDVVLLDMNFNSSTNNGNEGLYWTNEIKHMSPTTEVVLFTAYADIALAVEGMRRGAFDFITKPWDNEKLISTLSAARDKAMKANSKVEQKPEAPVMYWGDSDKMMSIKHSLAKIAPTDASVLITGENGTGKDLLAREVHEHSLRSSGPFVAVDAGAIPETLFESELFGHVKGAFTDAHADHVGFFQQADGGTLFLDEVGNIPLHLQAKLLRVLQNRSITRVGDSKNIPIDIRLICATNTNLEKSVSEGRFREDLYYRINTVHFELPPLRDRKNDIIPLAERFVKIFNEKYHRSVEGISAEAGAKLKEYSWSGNIRELRNAVEKAVILADGKLLEPKDFALKEYVPQASSAETLEEAEENVIREAMERYGGNLTKVAQALNISRPTLYKKLNKYNI
jgi:DNA-binding NtrC family response regulator